MTRPDPSEYAPYYRTYTALVTEDDVLTGLDVEIGRTLETLRAIPEDESLRRHAPYTWSIREVVGHLVDAERVFGYRALRFARGDETPLPGFDENAYVVAGRFDDRPLADVAEEFAELRRSHLHFFRGLPEEAWSLGGSANGSPVTVRALAAILLGHERHHMTIVRRRVAGAKG